jgi:nucleoside-diphosphate-sugar epimerase
MKILVTGAGGVVGRHLADALQRAGHEVFGLSRNPEKARNSHPGLDGKLTWIPGDILDVLALETAVKEMEVLVHAAGMVSFQPADRDLLMKINAEGTANVVNACLASGSIKKLIHISSVACLSPSKPMPSEVDERQGFNPDATTSDYAMSKYAAEMEVCRAVEEGLPALILNPSIVLAPGKETESSAALLHYAQKPQWFYPSGWINFVDARDLADVLLRVMENIQGKGERLVVSGGCLSYFDFFSKVAKRKGIRPPVFQTGAIMTGIAWRAASVWSFLTSKKPLLTRFTANSASKRFIYKGVAFKEFLGNHSYRSLDETLDWVIDKKS